MCAMASKSYVCDVTNSQKAQLALNDQEMANCELQNDLKK